MEQIPETFWKQIWLFRVRNSELFKREKGKFEPKWTGICPNPAGDGNSGIFLEIFCEFALRVLAYARRQIYKKSLKNFAEIARRTYAELC